MSTTTTKTGMESTKSKKVKSSKKRAREAAASHENAATNGFEKSQEPAGSPFEIQTTSLYVPLAAISMNNPLPGLCAQHLSSLLLTYYPPVRGTVLAYENVRISDRPLSGDNTDSAEPVLALSVDEYPVSFVWLTADFLVFRPAKGVSFEGYVNVHNQSHLGLLCYNLFNVSIPASRLPKDWSWDWADEGRAIPPVQREQGDSPPPSGQADGSWSGQKTRQGRGTAGEGYFKNAEGEKVQGLIQFRVRDVETAAWSEKEKGFIGIEGTLLSEEDDKVVDEAEQEQRRTARGQQRNKHGHR